MKSRYNDEESNQPRSQSFSLALQRKSSGNEVESKRRRLPLFTREIRLACFSMSSQKDIFHLDFTNSLCLKINAEICSK